MVPDRKSACTSRFAPIIIGAYSDVKHHKTNTIPLSAARLITNLGNRRRRICRKKVRVKPMFRNEAQSIHPGHDWVQVKAMALCSHMRPRYWIIGRIRLLADIEDEWYV